MRLTLLMSACLMATPCLAQVPSGPPTTVITPRPEADGQARPLEANPGAGTARIEEAKPANAAPSLGSPSKNQLPLPDQSR